MSVPSTHSQDFRHQTDAPAEAREERQASPLLWGLLILLLIAAPAWWWIRNSNDEPGTATVTPATPTTQVMPAPAEQRQPGMVRSESQRRTPAVVANRDARPLSSNAMPTYPPRALRAGIEGGMVARIQVDPRGNVSDVSIVERKGSRDRDLDRAVINTVRGWHFEPAMRDGRAVASTVQVPVEFRTAQ